VGCRQAGRGTRRARGSLTVGGKALICAGRLPSQADLFSAGRVRVSSPAPFLEDAWDRHYALALAQATRSQRLASVRPRGPGRRRSILSAPPSRVGSRASCPARGMDCAGRRANPPRRRSLAPPPQPLVVVGLRGRAVLGYLRVRPDGTCVFGIEIRVSGSFTARGSS